MTLQPYTPERLDELALQLLDLASAARGMASRCRDNELERLEIHDRKANEWIANLEQWMAKSASEIEVQIIRSKAERRAKGA